MIVREAALSDCKKLARVRIDAWKSTYSGLLPNDFLNKLSYEQSEKQWEQALNPKTKPQHSFVFIALDGDEPYGFVSGGLARDSDVDCQGEIYAIYILERFQKRGLGKQLLNAGVQRLIELGINSLVIWVLEGNDESARFYERQGGKKIAEKTMRIGELDYKVTGYGWPDLAGLNL